MKIIGSDYDGTLNHNGIDDVKKAAISKWRSKGNVFALVTGRGIEDLIELYARHSFECDYFVGYNGAVITKTDGTVVFSAECDGKLAPRVVKHLLDMGCFEIWIGAEQSFEVFEQNIAIDESSGVTLKDVPSFDSFLQISALCNNSDESKAVVESLDLEFGDLLNPLQNDRCINIVRKDINKARGLYALMELLNAEYDDVIAVGDNVNDRDMIAEFRSYAMENGVDLIKNLADFVTPGVTELIEKELAASV